MSTAPLDLKGTGIVARQLRNGATAYRVHFRVAGPGGLKQATRQFDTPEEAIAFKARFARKNGAAPRERYTVAGFINSRWLPNAEQRQKPSSLRAAQSYLAHYILPHFGATPLDKIGRAQWEQFCLTVQGAGGRALSAKTKQNLFSLFHAVLQYAVELELLDRNPIARPLGSRRNILRPASQRRDEKPVLSPEQFQKLLAATTEHRRPLIWTFAITGLRASEVAGLKWADYDVAGNALHVRRGVVRGAIGTPKTNATVRQVGVTALLAQQLADQRLNQTALLGRKPTANDFIFGSPNGRPLDADRARRQILYPAMCRAGLITEIKSTASRSAQPLGRSLADSALGRSLADRSARGAVAANNPARRATASPHSGEVVRSKSKYPQPSYGTDRNFGWHLFRHSAATAHLIQTGDIYRTSKFLGHSNVQITAGTYAHLKPAAVAESELVQSFYQQAAPASYPAVTSAVTSRSSNPN